MPTLSNVKLVVFDWNATLFADTAATFESSSRVVKAYGGKGITLKQFRTSFGVPVMDFYIANGCSKALLRKNPETASAMFHDYYEKRAAKCRTRAGAKKLLQWLEKHSVKSIILSDHTVEGIASHLRRLGLEKFFDAVVANSSRHSSLNGLHKSDSLKHYLKTHGYSSKEVVVVGDGPQEMEFGRKMGLTTITITHGYYSAERLKAEKPDFIVSNLAEIIPLVRGNGIR